MTTILGDITQLSQLQATLTDQSAIVNELTRLINNKIGTTAWEGPAASRFRAMWEGEFKPVLGKLAVAMNDAGTEVARRRDALVAGQA